MKLLLDTCVFLWIIWDEPALRPAMREVLSKPEHDLYVSSVSIWEATQKHALGRLEVRSEEGAWAHFIAQREAHGLIAQAFEEADARHLGQLPLLHRDPFDRMLICQAIERGLTLVTPDHTIRRYPLKTLWD
ncbi:MAG TPA: PIN domain nuclease [Gammaproteobacteria bacterium]|nr:PIN domain nuclease [Gammaproteobacteria bacterium]